MDQANPQESLNKIAQGIAILIELAQEGEIDPWNVQVIEEIDKYLNSLTQENTFDTGLSHSSQAFLWASKFMLIKADTLNNISSLQALLELAESTIEEIDQTTSLNHSIRNVSNLEKFIRRRLTNSPLSKRKITIKDLVEQLQEITKSINNQPQITKKSRTKRSSAETAKAIAELAHQENLTEIASELDQFLNNYWKTHSNDLEFEELVTIWNQTQPHPDESSDRIGIFWALLLLSAQSKVELSQTQLYQPIQINSFTPSPDT